MPSLLVIVRLSYGKLGCGHVRTVLHSMYVGTPVDFSLNLLQKVNISSIPTAIVHISIVAVIRRYPDCPVLEYS